MSNDPSTELIESVMLAVAELQNSTDQVDEAAAERLGLNRTDLRCLDCLARASAMTAGQLAAAVGLSSGAATTAVDRLVRAGYAERVRDEEDRRTVTVRPTPLALARSDEIWGPIGRESFQRLSRRTDSELRVILDFLTEGRQLQIDHTTRIRSHFPSHTIVDPV